MSFLSNLCNPAMIYIIMSIITMTVSSISSFNIVSILVSTILVLAWTYFLNYLCSKGYSTISWVLVIIPLISMALALNMKV